MGENMLFIWDFGWACKKYSLNTVLNRIVHMNFNVLSTYSHVIPPGQAQI
jgi:hypothetical protein